MIDFPSSMKLVIKSPLVFIFSLLKWSLLFVLIAVVRIFAVREYSSFSILLSECIKSVCIYFPAIYSLSFLETLISLMKNNNKSFLPIAVILIPLLLLVLTLQPFMYSYLRVLSLQSTLFTSNTVDASSSISHFLQTSSTLNSFLRQVYLILDDFRQAYFEGFLQYLLLSFAYVFFLFSLSIFTIKARWKGFNLLAFLLTFRIFILLYSVMNCPEAELYFFWFSTNQLKGFPTCIISIVVSSLICFYGFFSRVKKVF